MYIDGEFQDANDISTMNSMLKIIAIEPHLSEYDHNLNGLNKDEIFQRFTPIQEKENNDEMNFVNRMKFEGGSDYEIVKIDSHSQAAKYAKFTPWCVTHDQRHFDSYSCDGINQFYFCLKKGFENVEKNDVNAPLNEYGLSMISVCVDYNGMPLYITTRYNHDFNGENNEELRTPRQVSEVINMNFFEVFKPSEKGVRLNKYTIQSKLDKGVEMDSLFDKVDKITDDFYLVQIGDKQSFVYKKKLICEWMNNIRYNLQKIEFVEEKNGKPVINYHGDINLFNCKLTSLPLYFNEVDGDFVCSHNQLTSLEGAPEEVRRQFNCSYNQLTSLEGAPRKVGSGFYCNENRLTSLEGAPEEVGGKFYCHNNKLTSLEGAPRKVGGDFKCNYNELTSLEGAPETVKDDFYCNDNELTSLEGAPRKVGGDFDCSYNKLTSLEGAPEEVGDKFYCHNNKLTSLEGAPRKVGGDFKCNYNELTSLKGSLEEVGGGFDCRDNQLTSLEGGPKTVGRGLDCRNNQLKSLKGAPEVGRTIFSDFDYRNF
jgi:hypothetical protein